MLSESSTHHITHPFRISTFRVMVMSPTTLRSPRPFPSRWGEAMAAAAAVVPATGAVDTATFSVGCSATSACGSPSDTFSVCVCCCGGCCCSDAAADCFACCACCCTCHCFAFGFLVWCFYVCSHLCAAFCCVLCRPPAHCFCR